MVLRSPRMLVPFFFIPAGLGLIVRAASSATLAEQLLALALALFCPELARMALVDLDNIAAFSHQQDAGQPVTETESHKLIDRFFKVAVSTIVLEATGFYTALISLQWGAIAIILSQLWFNLLAGIALQPNLLSDPSSGESRSIEMRKMGIQERGAVLIANAIGLALLSLWFLQETRIWLASGLLILVLLFLVIKYAIVSPRSR
ncbi:MAG: hypothetical protein WBC73_06810 [Phormidesmis sp.]